MTEDSKPKIFYGWYIVVAAFFIQLVAVGVLLSFGIFFKPILTEFGWTRATLSGTHSLAFLMLGFASIFVGRLGDRFGPRMVMAICGLLMGLGYLLMSQISALWQLYLFYSVIVGIGVSAPDVLLLSTVARWFVKKRGMMSGIIKVGTGVGMVVMPIVANWLISTYGWRNSYLILGSVVLVLVVLAAMFLRRDPGQMGLAPYGEEEVRDSNLAPTEGGFSLREAIGTRHFWMVCAIYFVIIFCSQTLTVHIAPHAIELGVSATNAATVLATIGGGSIGGRVIMGSAGDRVGTRLAISICFVISVTALSWLQFATELWGLYLFAFVYGFAHGGFFALISPLIAELFGLSSHGAIFGLVYFCGTIGGAAGPFLGGRIFDVNGSYQLAFLICAALGAVALILSLLLRRSLPGAPAGKLIQGS